MTEKEKLKKIKKLADAMYYAAQYLTTDASRLHKAMDEYHQFIIHEYHKEEPVSIWHSIEELPTAREYEYILVIYKDTTAPCVAGNKTQVSYWDRVDKWAYLEDVLNLSNIKRTIRDWKEPVSDDTMTIRKDWFEHCKKSWYNEGYIDGKHNRDGQFGEPVSDECIYNRTLEERQRSCKFCSAACQVRIKEPVSDDFEEALAREWQGYKDRGAATVDALEDNTQKLAFTKGFYRGAKWQKEQMIAKAVDGGITFDYYGNDDKTYGCIAHNSFCLEDFGLKDRDKVKMILIKE